MRLKYPLLITTVALLVFLFFYVFPLPCTPPSREIAITIDDIPMERSSFIKIMEHFKSYHVPVTAFVIANRVNADEFSYLNSLRNSQFIIGSHSYSHPSLRRISAKQYIADIKQADTLLASLMSEPKYYRYPYLAMGSWFKKRQVLHYLTENKYTVAPVTIDSRDFLLNIEFCAHPPTKAFIDQIRQRYLDFVWQQTIAAERGQRCNGTKQILLIHANVLNSYFLGDLLKMYQEHGYRFISLGEALATDHR